jgi:hypothetical protein
VRVVLALVQEESEALLVRTTTCAVEPSATRASFSGDTTLRGR